MKRRLIYAVIAVFVLVTVSFLMKDFFSDDAPNDKYSDIAPSESPSEDVTETETGDNIDEEKDIGDEGDIGEQGDTDCDIDKQSSIVDEDEFVYPNKNYMFYNYDLELPVIGATGYATTSIDIVSGSSGNGSVKAKLKQGECFLILNEDGDWWEISSNDFRGWIKHDYCMINLPDVIPSIIYDGVNTYSSRFTSSGENIPNITGEQLYEVEMYNNRLKKTEFVMPVMYSMAKKIFNAQKSALANGDSLIIYETFRPYPVQTKIVEELRRLSNSNDKVNQGINSQPWHIGWFISTGISNHQKGGAIDVALVEILEAGYAYMGKYAYVEIYNYKPYDMPSPIHELSSQSVVFEQPIRSSPTGWIGQPLSAAMRGNPPAIKLQKYCTDAGLTPLASEWWHFDDLHTLSRMSGNNGDYFLSELRSVPFE